MPKLPAVNGDEVVQALLKAGFVLDRWRGSHAILFHPRRQRVVVVPCHKQDLQPGILHAIIKDAGLTVEQFRRLLK